MRRRCSRRGCMSPLCLTRIALQKKHAVSILLSGRSIPACLAAAAACEAATASKWLACPHAQCCSHYALGAPEDARCRHSILALSLLPRSL